MKIDRAELAAALGPGLALALLMGLGLLGWRATLEPVEEAANLPVRRHVRSVHHHERELRAANRVPQSTVKRWTIGPERSRRIHELNLRSGRQVRQISKRILARRVDLGRHGRYMCIDECIEQR